MNRGNWWARLWAGSWWQSQYHKVRGGTLFLESSKSENRLFPAFIWHIQLDIIMKYLLPEYLEICSLLFFTCWCLSSGFHSLQPGLLYHGKVLYGTTVILQNSILDYCNMVKLFLDYSNNSFFSSIECLPCCQNDLPCILCLNLSPSPIVTPIAIMKKFQWLSLEFKFFFFFWSGLYLLVFFLNSRIFNNWQHNSLFSLNWSIVDTQCYIRFRYATYQFDTTMPTCVASLIAPIVP